MQTIETTYFGPTNKRAARIRVKASGGVTLFFSWEKYTSVLSKGADEDIHAQAAADLCRHLAWCPIQLIGGGLKNGSMVWIIVSPQSPRINLT